MTEQRRDLAVRVLRAVIFPGCPAIAHALVARVERSGTRGGGAISPGFRFAPPGLRLRLPARRRRVLAGELRGVIALAALGVMLEPGNARPGALELVAHADPQPTQPLDLELDAVAVLERVQAAMIGAGRQHITGLQGVDRADELDAARDLVGHVVGVEV